MSAHRLSWGVSCACGYTTGLLPTMGWANSQAHRHLNDCAGPTRLSNAVRCTCGWESLPGRLTECHQQARDHERTNRKVDTTR